MEQNEVLHTDVGLTLRVSMGSRALGFSENTDASLKTTPDPAALIEKVRMSIANEPAF